MKPIVFGDTKYIVATLNLDRQGLEYLLDVVYRDSPNDEFVKEIASVLDDLDAQTHQEVWEGFLYDVAHGC